MATHTIGTCHEWLAALVNTRAEVQSWLLPRNFGTPDSTGTVPFIQRAIGHFTRGVAALAFAA